jgi:hypothetical protein
MFSESYFKCYPPSKSKERQKSRGRALPEAVRANYRNLCKEVHSMRRIPIDLAKIQRKFGKFLKTSRCGDTLFLWHRFTDQGVRITLYSDRECDGVFLPQSVEMYHSPSGLTYCIAVDYSKDLLSKILFKYQLFHVE